MPCALVATSTPLIPRCIQLLSRTELLLCGCALPPEQASPRWLAPLVLFIDLVEKIAVASHRRAAVAQVSAQDCGWMVVQTDSSE